MSIYVIDNSRQKSQIKRIYPLLPEIKTMLQDMLNEQEENKRLLGNDYTDTGYIFVKADGIPFYPSYPSHELRKALKKHNLPHIRWHDLRHSTTSLLIRQGIHPKPISEWIGHSSIGTTMNIYGHINMEDKKAISAGLSGLLA